VLGIGFWAHDRYLALRGQGRVASGFHPWSHNAEGSSDVKREVLPVLRHLWAEKGRAGGRYLHYPRIGASRKESISCLRFMAMSQRFKSNSWLNALIFPMVGC